MIKTWNKFKLDNPIKSVNPLTHFKNLWVRTLNIKNKAIKD